MLRKHGYEDTYPLKPQWWGTYSSGKKMVLFKIATQFWDGRFDFVWVLFVAVSETVLRFCKGVFL